MNLTEPKTLFPDNPYETAVFDWIKEHIEEDKRRFVDITHDGTGRICNVYYNPQTRQYEYEPIENNRIR